jgi:hypothetical protein
MHREGITAAINRTNTLSMAPIFVLREDMFVALPRALYGSYFSGGRPGNFPFLEFCASASISQVDPPTVLTMTLSRVMNEGQLNLIHRPQEGPDKRDCGKLDHCRQPTVCASPIHASGFAVELSLISHY